MNKDKWILIAGSLGFLGVALGAFGAHALRNVLSEEMLRTYNTGILYHLIHSVAILALSLSGDRFMKAAAFLFIGVILFSFSLYAYSITGIRWIAMITPFGGVSFLIGWMLIILSALRKK